MKKKDNFGLTPEDMAEFREAMERMHEQSLKNNQPVEEDDDYYALTGIPAKRRPDAHDTMSLELTDREQFGPEDKLSFCKPGIQHKQFGKLKKGQLPPEAELDFHGMTANEAADSLGVFFSHCHQLNIRVVRVIHGKGQRSAEGIPILKNLLNQWLKNRPDVLAFCSATPKDGGAGAVYVLLKNM